MSSYNINPLAFSSTHWALERADFILPPLFVRYAGFGFLSDKLNIDVELSESQVYIDREVISENVEVVFDLSEGVLENTYYLDFEHVFLYTIPSGDNLPFIFGSASLGYAEVTPDLSEIVFDLSEGSLSVGHFLVPDFSEIVLDLSDGVLDIMVDIENEFSDAVIEPIDHLFQILPDMLSDPTEVEVSMTGSVMRSTEAHHLPVKIKNPGININWETKPKHRNTVLNVPWNKSIEADLIVNVPINKPKRTDSSVSVCWSTMLQRDSTVSAPYLSSEALDRHYTYPFLTGQRKADITTIVSYDSFASETDIEITVPYQNPWLGAFKDTHLSVTYHNKAEKTDKEISVPYNEPGIEGYKDRHVGVVWGPRNLSGYCTYDYLPPKSLAVDFDFITPIGDVPDKDTINVYFETMRYPLRCIPLYYPKSGQRDTSSEPITLSNVYYPKPQKVYYMLNSLHVKELTTNKPIECLGVSITTDRNSWLWQFNIVVASKDCLELIKPAYGVFVTLVVDINGWQFYCTVEGWSENRKFGGDSWNITGRSHSLMFGHPISPKISYTENTGMQGEQLINGIVETKNVPTDWPSQLGNWTANWEVYYNGAPSDPGGITETGFGPNTQWYIPGGTLSYSNMSEIEVMKNIVNGIGAYIQTEPNENKLTVRPIYPHMPWNWTADNTSIAYKGLIEDQFTEVSRSYDSRVPYQAVHVMGETQSGTNDGSNPISTLEDGTVFVDVRYNGCSTSTASYAPTVTNRFVTSTKAALELGRPIIGSTGEWVNHTLKIATLCPPGTHDMGLFRPGDMLSIVERGATWQCQVTGVSINAASSGSAFVVTQVLNVEQYVGGTPSC